MVVPGSAQFLSEPHQWSSFQDPARRAIKQGITRLIEIEHRRDRGKKWRHLIGATCRLIAGRKKRTIAEATDLLAFSGGGIDTSQKEFIPFQIYEIRGKINF